jgi:hypothetical protein
MYFGVKTFLLAENAKKSPYRPITLRSFGEMVRDTKSSGPLILVSVLSCGDVNAFTALR